MPAIQSAVCIFLLWLCTVGPAQADSLTLEQALAVALQHNHSLRERQLQSLIPALQVEREQSPFHWQLRPTISLTQDQGGDAEGRASLLLSRALHSGGQVRVEGVYTADAAGESDRWVAVSLEQALFRYAGREMADRDLLAAEYQAARAERALLAERARVLLDTVMAFTETRRLERRCVLEREALARAHSMVRLVELRLRQGQAGALDEMEVRMLHRSAELRLLQLEAEAAAQRNALAMLMGTNLTGHTVLQPAVHPRVPSHSLDEAVEAALHHRVERAQAVHDYEEALRQMSVRRRELYPDVRLLLSYRPVPGEDQAEWAAGIAGGQGLDLSSERSAVHQAEHSAQAVLVRWESLDQQIRREVGDAMTRLRAAEASAELAVEQEKLAAMRYRLARQLYEKQRGSVLSLREAEQAQVDAEARRTDASTQHIQAQYRYLYVTGRLLEP